MTRLLLYGYGNDSMVRFLQVLQQHGITGVLDIRDDGLLIRNEFNPENLADLLHRLSIQYSHATPLVIPNSLAHRPRSNGSAGDFLAQYQDYLESLGPGELAELADLLQAGTWLMLCAEEDPDICHRRIAAEFVGRRLGLPADAIQEVGHSGSV
ncbi:MAG TPA: DUF488 domain-containing protein [bacterium]|nr:DUF488 domain-containing protein [bacterium]